MALAEKFGLPVHAIGVGETADDMRPFHPTDFARSLMGLSGDEAVDEMEPVAPVLEEAEPEPEPEAPQTEPEPESASEELAPNEEPEQADIKPEEPTVEPSKDDLPPRKRLFGLRW